MNYLSEQRRPPRLAEAVADSLRDRILNNEFADGDSLPKQEDLVRQYRVSLPSVREALRGLETEGLVTVQRGKIGGSIVHVPRAGKVAYMLGLVLQSRQVEVDDVVHAMAQIEEPRGRSKRWIWTPSLSSGKTSVTIRLMILCCAKPLRYALRAEFVQIGSALHHRS